MTTTSGHGRPASVEQPHRDDVHEADVVGDREIVVAGGDHDHLGHGEQRHGGVVAEDGAESLDAGEGLRQQQREDDDQQRCRRPAARASTGRRAGCASREALRRSRRRRQSPRVWSGLRSRSALMRAHDASSAALARDAADGVGQRLDADRSPRVSSATMRPRLKASTRSQICTSSSMSEETTMYGGAGGGVSGHHPVDLGLGADVDADRRVLQDEQAVVLPGPAGQHDLLLVAAGQRGDVALGIAAAGRRIGAGSRRRRCVSVARLRSRKRVAPKLSGLRNRFSLTDMVRRERLLGALAGGKADAGAMASPARPERIARPSSDIDAARRGDATPAIVRPTASWPWPRRPARPTISPLPTMNATGPTAPTRRPFDRQGQARRVGARALSGATRQTADDVGDQLLGRHAVEAGDARRCGRRGGPSPHRRCETPRRAGG